MDKILHYLKDPKLWELWYIPCYGSCRIHITLNPHSPIDPLKEPLKGTLIDPFKGTPGFCASTVPSQYAPPSPDEAPRRRQDLC